LYYVVWLLHKASNVFTAVLCITLKKHIMKYRVKNRPVYTKTHSLKKIHLIKAGSQYGLTFDIVATLKNKDKI